MSIAYRADIDGLRAFAILSVFLFHINPDWLSGGFLGVDIFFVISGYLITSIILREHAAGHFSFTNFYIRRIKRLFPALAVVLIAVLGFGYFALLPDEFEDVGRHAYASAGFYLNFQLIKEAGYFDIASIYKPLMHLWSLSVEEQFYFVWPIILCFVIASRSRERSVAESRHYRIAIAGLFILSFSYMIYLSQTNLDALYFHPLARFWELLIGVAIAYEHRQKTQITCPSWLKQMLSVTALATLVGSFIFFTRMGANPGPLTLIPVLATATLIALPPAFAGHAILKLKPFVLIGLISYPLYLWHWPLLSYLRVMEGIETPPLLLLSAVVLSFLLAWATYIFAERPIRRLNMGFKPVYGLLASLACIVLVAQIVVKRDGLPARHSLSDIQMALSQTQREPQTDPSCTSLFSHEQAPTYCRGHALGDKMIAVIGDSHAHVLFPGVAGEAEKRGYGTLLLANSSCPPLLGTPDGRNDLERKLCTENIEKILQYLKTDRRVSHVLIVTRGPIYITGEGFGPAESDYHGEPIQTFPIPSENSEEAYFAGLTNTVEAIQSAGKKVNYFLQVPELGIIPNVACIDRPLRFKQTSQCSVPLAEVENRMQSYRIAAQKLEEKLAEFKVIDPSPLLCDTDQCYGMIDGKLIYADDDHLSVNGSHYVAGHIMQTLVPQENP